jgi:C1A family cysteine protease
VIDASTVAPRGADMRAILPPVRDQGQRGTCVAFAVTAAHEMARAAGIAVAEDLSEEALYWGCKLIDGNWHTGTIFTSAAAALAATGQPVEAVWPYNSRRSAGIAYAPPSAPSADWHLSSLNPMSIDLPSVRVELDAGRPVVLGLELFDTLLIPSAAGRIEAPPPGSGTRGRHAVLAVGHATSALLIRNSWGMSWALSGYGWLSDDYAVHHVKEAWVLEPSSGAQTASPGGPTTGHVYGSA